VGKVDTKPAEVRGRDAEWRALADFARSTSPVGAVGLLYGRRRTGKSFLLRRLVESVGGIYFQATESERPDALAEFGNAIGQAAIGQAAMGQTAANAQPPEPIVYSDWDDALRRRTGLVVIDEFPYLLRHSPELPSLLQRIIDEASNSARPPIRIIVCGSSLSVMSTLLRGQEPLRGRATLDLFLRPMDHRQTAELWDVSDLDLAVRLHAIFGGAPGYRALTTAVPESADQLGEWLSTNVLNPSHALYREDEYLLQEERTITDRALYGSILRAIASGVASQTELAGRLGRSRESLTHQLATLIRAGFVVRAEDLLSPSRPEHRLADPIIRFIRLVVDPSRALLDEGRWDVAWERAAHRLDANIFGPHLEQIAHRWASITFEPSAGGFVSHVGHTRVADPRTRKSIDIDLAALGEDADGKPAIRLLAEVKWSANAFGSGAIDRLSHARDLLGALGHNVASCELALISRDAPTAPSEGLRVGLHELYRACEGTPKTT
jgi:uncharacterized protein